MKPRVKLCDLERRIERINILAARTAVHIQQQNGATSLYDHADRPLICGVTKREAAVYLDGMIEGLLTPRRKLCNQLG